MIEDCPICGASVRERTHDYICTNKKCGVPISKATWERTTPRSLHPRRDPDAMQIINHLMKMIGTWNIICFILIALVFLFIGMAIDPNISRM